MRRWGNPAKCLLSHRENLPGQFKFKEYCPQVYRNLRERFGIEDRDYQVWLWSPTSATPKSQCCLWVKNGNVHPGFRHFADMFAPVNICIHLWAICIHRASSFTLPRTYLHSKTLMHVRAQTLKRTFHSDNSCVVAGAMTFSKTDKSVWMDAFLAAGGALVILSPTGFSSTQSSHQKWRWGVCGAADDVIRPHAGGERNL